MITPYYYDSKWYPEWTYYDSEGELAVKTSVDPHYAIFDRRISSSEPVVFTQDRSLAETITLALNGAYIEQIGKSEMAGGLSEP